MKRCIFLIVIALFSIHVIAQEKFIIEGRIIDKETKTPLVYASIIFSDEGDILKDSSNPDLDYNQLIRPWKSRLGLLYTYQRTFWMDIKLIVATILAVLDREKALQMVHKMLIYIEADNELVMVCLRSNELTPTPPPGAGEIVQSRE